MAPQRRKNTENHKELQKFLQFCVFILTVPKHAANKLVIKNNYVRQMVFSIFEYILYRTDQTKKLKS